MERVICLLIGYVFGMFQTAYLYGKANGIDIRTKGSGNAGTTNALRTLGLKAGPVSYTHLCFKIGTCAVGGKYEEVYCKICKRLFLAVPCEGGLLLDIGD